MSEPTTQQKRGFIKGIFIIIHSIPNFDKNQKTPSPQGKDATTIFILFQKFNYEWEFVPFTLVCFYCRNDGKYNGHN